MKVRLTLTSNEEKEIFNIEDVNDPNVLEFIDDGGAKNLLKVFDNGIDIERKADTHQTNLTLRSDEKSFVVVSSLEGILQINVKTLAFERNNDIITLVYSVNDERKAITINYLGV